MRYESIAEAPDRVDPGPGRGERGVRDGGRRGPRDADGGTPRGARGRRATCPDLEPRDASRAELQAWARAARRGTGRRDSRSSSGEARDASCATCRRGSPRRFDAFEASATLAARDARSTPTTTSARCSSRRTAIRIVDFEGEPLRTIEERRALDSPLRDVASMLRSLDHVGRSRRTAGRERERRGASERRAWTSPAGCAGRASGSWRPTGRDCWPLAPIVLDPTLLRAFELDKECHEFVYAATYLPRWLWAPTEGCAGCSSGPGRGDQRIAWRRSAADIARVRGALGPSCSRRGAAPSTWVAAVAGRLHRTRQLRYAALIVAAGAARQRRAAWAEFASAEAPTAPADDLVLVAISASGRTPRGRRGRAPASRHEPGRRRDERPDSPLAAEADVVVPLAGG